MRFKRLFQSILCFLVIGVPAFHSYGEEGTLLARIKNSGVLLVAIRNSPTTYYEGADGMKGLEYDLARLFAEELGVEVFFVVPAYFEDLLPMVQQGVVHLVAAGLTVTPEREKLVRFGPPYQQITQQVVYKAGNLRPRKVKDLIGREIEVVAGSSHEQELMRLSAKYPELKWKGNREQESEELLYRVKEGGLDLTIADSNEFALNRRYYPELTVGFDLTKSQSLAWAFQHSDDDSLFAAAKAFFNRIKSSGKLRQVIESHYGYVQRLNGVDTYRFQRHVRERLPKYVIYFKEAGRQTGLDWRLLAAIGYQESHWNPKAISPTGVRGIMMLTQPTAKQLGVDNRLDPEQSILGGASYVRMLEQKLPERIPEPDRLWLALAGYNVGFGHLEDARILTEQQGGDSDKWSDVKTRLPLLRQKKYYSQTRHGYARGQEPVDFVDSIRSYYDLLKWQLSKEGENILSAMNEKETKGKKAP